MINILVLMAGHGKRFSNYGYTMPKPIIKVKGKTILEWTTESCPYISHNTGGQNSGVNLCFAVLSEHLLHPHGLKDYLHKVYGENITIIPFETVTRGNLETARLACNHIKNNEPLLVLDADNKYNHNNLDKFLDNVPKDLKTMSIFCFNSKTETPPNKWCNARVSNGFALELREKDDLWIHYPCLIGIFYFTRVDQFKNYADFILQNGIPVGPEGKKEFYISMVPKYHAAIGQSVYVHNVTDVVPLGTPEDVERFKQ